jgi:hypothetical protein
MAGMGHLGRRCNREYDSCRQGLRAVVVVVVGAIGAAGAVGWCMMAADVCVGWSGDEEGKAGNGGAENRRARG